MKRTSTATATKPSDTVSEEPGAEDSAAGQNSPQNVDLADHDFNCDAQGAIDRSTGEVGDGIGDTSEVTVDVESGNATID